MSYSQKSLVDLFRAGKVPGETTVPKHIETVISNVFVFEENVYKFYKNDTEFFNANFRNLADASIRYAYSEQDFVWNNASSPSIYKEIRGARVSDEEVVFVGLDEEPEEFVIVMSRVDMRDVLFERLMRGDLTEEDSYNVGKGLALSLEGVRQNSPGEQNYFEIFDSRIVDCRNWIASMEAFVPKVEADEYCNYLESSRQQFKEAFEQVLSQELAFGGDIHSHNAILAGDAFMLMDTYSPKEEWLVEHWSMPMYRIATDIWALTGDKNLFDACVRGYEDGMGMKVDRRFDAVFILYALTIAMPYHYMLVATDESKREAADRMHAFTRQYFATI